MRNLFIPCVLLFSSGTTLAESIDKLTQVSGIVAFGQPTQFAADMQTVSGLNAGVTPDNTLIATVGVTGGGGFWLIGIDPTDADAAGHAPDQGWTMKSKSVPTKTVKVKITNDNRVDYKPNLNNLNWNRMSADTRAKIVVSSQQNILAGDDYQLTVNVAKYIP
jgi:hypothetical protein